MDQWLRYCRLVVAENNTNTLAVDLSQFRIKFRIEQALVNKPCTAEITVYNLSGDTVNKIELGANEVNADKLSKVILEAGYQNGHSVIFDGDLWWKNVGRESEVDTYMKLIAMTGDRFFQYGIVNVSIKKGASQDDIFEVLKAALKEKGIDVDKMPKALMKTKLPRGKVICSLGRDALDTLADTNNFNYGFGAKGLITESKEAVYNTSETVTIVNSATGMIGRPVVTPTGVSCRVLLNPKLDVGSLVQIDQKSIIRSTYSTEISEEAVTKNLSATNDMIAADGIYRVIAREHVGDTRGSDWYTNLTCVGVKAVQPITPSVLLFTTNN